VPKDSKKYLKVVYGTEAMIMNVSKLIILLVITLLIGSFVQTLAVLVGFNIIRHWAFGLHASSGIGCTVGSILLFVGMPFLLRGFEINNLIVTAVFALIIVLLWFYAPADTASRPLVGKKTRKKFKKLTIISAVLLLAVLLFISDGNIKAMVTLGAVYEAISILPLTYKILQKSMNNYRKYEGATQ
jgi:accessory gene regulator B